MGGAISGGVTNDDLIDKLKNAGYINGTNTEILLRVIDRRFYMIAKELQGGPYNDCAWKYGGLHLSAPCIYAKVLDELELEKNQAFLNLGSGTGYLSTMAALVIGSLGINHGVELNSEALKYSQDRLECFKHHHKVLHTMDFGVPVFFKGNGFCIKPTTKYDRIYCGASIEEKDKLYIVSLLKEEGIAVFPSDDSLVKLVKESDDKFNCEMILPVSFSDMLPPTESDDVITLPGHEPLPLLSICRRKILSCIRSSTISDGYDYCAGLSRYSTRTINHFQPASIVPPDFYCRTYILDLPYSKRVPEWTNDKESLTNILNDESFSNLRPVSYNDWYELCKLDYMREEGKDMDNSDSSSDTSDDSSPLKKIKITEAEYSCQGLKVAGDKYYEKWRSPTSEHCLEHYSKIIENSIDKLPLPNPLKKFVSYCKDGR